MRSLKFLTWLDVKRFIQRETANGENLPECINSIACFSDALEINIPRAEYKQDAQKVLSEWFKDWYQQDQNEISLDLGNVGLPIEFHEDRAAQSSSPRLMRPFWQEIAYICDNSENNSEEQQKVPSNFHFPESPLSSPKVIAFYSFKGGVGRTLHLAAYLFALLEVSKEKNKKIRVLVIDSDLEAPGLTYWDRAEKQQTAISFIDFLEAYHYSPINHQEILGLLADEIKKNPKQEGGSIFYFLPACLNDEQLLDTPVLPEHLARSSEGVWTCGDAIHELGKELSVDYILIDLRAGLSEISSPIIFDPRIQRFFVTTATEQSTSGISLVLQKISHIAPSREDSNSGKFYDPSIIISFLTPELKKLPAFESSLERINAAYNPVDQLNDDNLYVEKIMQETDFTQELLYINSWEEAKNKLNSTSVMKVAKEWAESELAEDFQDTDFNNTRRNTSTSSISEEVRKFKDVCRQYIFAESGEGESLLVTESLKNLAMNFRKDLPRVVSIGAKGSGKTFTYVQLSRLKFWENFVKQATKDFSESDPKIHIFPLLQSSTLRDAAETIVREARASTQKAFPDSIPDFYHSKFKDSIQIFLENDHHELDWTKFWIQKISKSVGLQQNPESASLHELNNYLKKRGIYLVFLFDGLEDIFPETATKKQQQTALNTLINLPKRLNEIRQANFGLIILLRRDFLRYSITQNLAQFEDLYKPYDLSWDVDSFLKLVYWICSKASVINANEDTVDSLNREELVSNLANLWGTKLGKDTSKEAYTAKWIYAALTDFKGRLQARDIVRLLYNAADITLENSGGVKFELWSASRLLPPQAIRRAIEPCSAEKVKEVKEEYPEFREWVDTVEEWQSGQKRVPFTLDKLSISQRTLKMLEDIGVIYEDKGQEDVSRYYMPEIYRSGLGFTLENGARPRVLVLKRKALGADIL